MQLAIAALCLLLGASACAPAQLRRGASSVADAPGAPAPAWREDRTVTARAERRESERAERNATRGSRAAGRCDPRICDPVR